MAYHIVYCSAVQEEGGWLPKVAYIRNGIPLILEGDPRCPYNTRQEALAHVDELRQHLCQELGEPEGSPSGQK